MSKSDLDQFKRVLEGVDSSIISDHLARLPDRYFETFSFEEQCDHLRLRQATSRDKTRVEVSLNWVTDHDVTVTIASFDFPQIFMMITGVLSSLSLNIEAGMVFTYRSQVQSKEAVRRFLERRLVSTALPRPIVDTFRGRLTDKVSFQKWHRELVFRLNTVVDLLYIGDKVSLERAGEWVNRWVSDRISTIKGTLPTVLYPIELSVGTEDVGYTRIRIVSQDTPFFLYALASAMHVHQLSIEMVSIETHDMRVEDELFVLDREGRPLTSQLEIDRLKVSVMLTKQFTFFLDRSPNPFDALSRFGQLLREVLQLSSESQWIGLLSDPKVLKEFAKILGTSDYLWEDFIRLHHDALLPTFKPHIDQLSKVVNLRELSIRFRRALRGKGTLEEKVQALNEFKDRENYYIDLHHMSGEFDFRELSRQLTLLADLVVRVLVKWVYQDLKRQFGAPTGIGGIDTDFAVMGLGKMGGMALGYASDIELMIVYEDEGGTSGEVSISNEAFFVKLVQGIQEHLKSKRDGIFQLDFRLRPYGNSGALAVSVESFNRYYGGFDGSSVHAYERLALVRMRFVAGHWRFGDRLIGLRDEFVYLSAELDVNALWSLRQKQVLDKVSVDVANAKFSAGALVDLEYAVQILQVEYGRLHPQLRVSSIHGALMGLNQVGVLTSEQVAILNRSYDFFRKLINGLRMLRGNAKDLNLPEDKSLELDHLARRVGYRSKNTVTPSTFLRVDFEYFTAEVRRFVATYFTQESIAHPAAGNIADLVLNDRMDEDRRRVILKRLGFLNVELATHNIQTLLSGGTQSALLASVLLLAVHSEAFRLDPDRVLNAWERFVGQIKDKNAHFKLVSRHPMVLDMVLDVFLTSDFLTMVLVSRPDHFEWVFNQKYLYKVFKRGWIDEELGAVAMGVEGRAQINMIRRREMLRIAIRDLYLQVPLIDVTTELTRLAQSIVTAVLARVWKIVPLGLSEDQINRLSEGLCLLSFGKMGGGELNYSSDLDLVAVFDEEVGRELGLDYEAVKSIYTRVIERFRDEVMRVDDGGAMYRIDFKLRPFGKSGDLVVSMGQFETYYQTHASLWEHQAFLRCMPAAGNWMVGFAVMDTVKALILEGTYHMLPRHVAFLREQSIVMAKRRRLGSIDIKNGKGGIRDIEFLVQVMQLQGLQMYPELFIGHTIKALFLLKRYDLLPRLVVDKLLEYYTFLRRLEHILQLVDDRQTHSIPKDPMIVLRISKRMMGEGVSAVEFVAKIEAMMIEIVSINRQYLGAGASGVVSK